MTFEIEPNYNAIIMLLLFLAFIYLSIILILQYNKKHPKLKLNVGKLKVGTLIRNIGILLLLPVNLYILYYALLNFNWNLFKDAYFAFPLLGIFCLTISVLLWLSEKIEVKNDMD